MTDFSDILKHPAMRTMIQASAQQQVMRSSSLVDQLLRPKEWIKLPPFMISDPDHVRAIHRELVTRYAHRGHRRNPREHLATRLMHAMMGKGFFGIDTEGGPQTGLLETCIKSLIELGIIHRKPFRVDNLAADAWLAACLLQLGA